MSYEKLIPDRSCLGKKRCVVMSIGLMFIVTSLVVYCLLPSLKTETNHVEIYDTTTPKNIRDFLYRFIDRYNNGASRVLIPVDDESQSIYSDED